MKTSILKNIVNLWLGLSLLAYFTSPVLGDTVQDRIDRLKNPDPLLRWGAAFGLGTLGDARAVEPLIACLKDQNSDVRWRAAEALGKLGDARAVEPLIACLNDESASVRQSVVESLGALGDARAAKPLTACLKDKNLQMRAAEALHKLGKPAVEPLIACLKDDDSKVRWRAAETLGTLGDARAVGPLIACLKDKNLQMRAAEALHKLGKPAVEPLIACLKDDNSEVRWQAAETLGTLSDARAVEPLIACLKDKNSEVRWQSARALGKLGDARAVEPLIACLKDERVLQWAAEALRKLGKPPVEPLVTCLKDENSDVRWQAAKALGTLSDARAVEPLIACLKDENPWVRLWVAEALGALGDTRAMEPLITCFKDENSDVRSQAAIALGKLGDARAVNPLREALPDWEANPAIVTGLEALGWQPATKDERVYQRIGKKNAPDLNTQWEETKAVLLSDVKSGNRRKIHNAVYTFMSLGRQDIISDLIIILNRDGNKEMAETYFNCGHDGLNLAAKEWASNHGFYFSPGAGVHKAGWASWQQ